jgi:hypothetical protein
MISTYASLVQNRPDDPSGTPGGFSNLDQCTENITTTDTRATREKKYL